MKLAEDEKMFVKRNREVLGRIFNKRIEELKEAMIYSQPEQRNRIADLVVELKYWLQDIKILHKPRKEKDNYI